MTYKLLAINIVPRHSYNSLSLYLDGKNCAPVFSASRRIRRGTACFAHYGLREILPRKGDTTRRPPFDYATFTHFIAGPLGIRPNLW
jgi:hypothetical protein